jgi:hypothetical protein
MGAQRAKVARHTERRILVASMRQVVSDRTRVSSRRQLPTDHDYAGGLRGSIREYQSDQPSSKAAPTFARNASPREGEKKTGKDVGEGLDRSLHIRSGRFSAATRFAAIAEYFFDMSI